MLIIVPFVSFSHVWGRRRRARVGLTPAEQRPEPQTKNPSPYSVTVPYPTAFATDQQRQPSAGADAVTAGLGRQL
jgi:hypothetical protein